MKTPTPPDLQNGMLPWDYFLEISEIICEAFVETMQEQVNHLWIERRRESVKTNDDVLWHLAWKEKELHQNACR